MPRKVKEERKIVYKTDGESEYGVVTKKLGGSRFSVRLNLSTKEMIGKLCGKFKKGSNKKENIVDIGSVVLLGFRDFQDTMAEIVYVYNNEEMRYMKKENIFSDDFMKYTDCNSGGCDTEQDTGVDFEFDEI